jgi:acetylornithine/N-succinyldiaminopimelate aminotransferase
VANAVLDVMLADGFFDHVVEMGNLMNTELAGVAERHPSVIESVRGAGLMWGMKCAMPNADLAAKAFEHGLLTVLAGDNVMRFLPPLIIEPAHIEEAVGILETCCGELEA